ncbi:MAG: hypothetical protein NTW29_19435 [Bacteroidetes bacterium]|nr:hypothetical protein [Bacteroidota bacterium]
MKENLLNQFGVQGESLSLWLKPENFIAFAEKTADGIEDPEKKKILRQALDRDVFVLRTLWKIEQEKAYYQVPLKEISQLMRSDPNDFSQMKFKQSNKVIVHSPEQTAINPADGDFGVFMSSYGMNAIYCRVVGDDELQVAGLGITKLIYDSYAQPASVNQVTENIIAYIFSNGEEVINWLKNNYRAPDNVTLKNILAVWVMDATQVCIMDGLLMPES